MLSDYLKNYRLTHGLTQSEMAKLLSLSQNAISQYEAGKRAPTLAKIYYIAERLGCAVSDIL